MLIAGLAAFPLFALTRSERLAPQSMMASIWRAERWLCAAGLLLSILGMGVLAASMQGVGLLSLGPARLPARGGAIWMARCPTTSAAVLAAAGSVAVASLVWSGHAGATEG